MGMFVVWMDRWMVEFERERRLTFCRRVLIYYVNSFSQNSGRKPNTAQRNTHTHLTKLFQRKKNDFLNTTHTTQLNQFPPLSVSAPIIVIALLFLKRAEKEQFSLPQPTAKFWLSRRVVVVLLSIYYITNQPIQPQPKLNLRLWNNENS